MLRPVSFVVGALLVGTPAYAQDLTIEIDRIFSWATPAGPGCAVAVSHHGKLVVNRAYGLADIERDVPNTPGTIFDAGSLQKQFVAAATLLLVDEGRLSLSEDIHKYVPELPDYGHKITVDHLLTHTSGIRDWTGMLPMAEDNPDALSLILRQRGLNFVPGEEWSYSNSGYVLLREIVARASGMSLAEFTRTRLFEPLGIRSTSFVDDILGVGGDRALAYEKQGDGWRQDMLLGNARGGGALATTAGDLVTWSDALASGRLGTFVSEKIHEETRLNNGRQLSYARGLFVDTNRGRRIWHTGSAAAYKSFLGRFPEQGLSIGIMCNSGDGTDRTMFASRILDLYGPGTRSAEANAPIGGVQGTGAAGLDLSGMAGLFFSERTGEPLRVIVNNGRLGIAGGPPLVAVAANRFRNTRGSLQLMSQDEFELHFLSPDQIELKSMEGTTTRYRRAEPFAPTTDELNVFAGRYGSDEIGAILQIAPGSGGLVMRFERSPERSLEMVPVDRDAFQRGMMTVRFLRGAGGTVVGFDYSNPVVRNIRFTRLSDGASRR